eukprot:1153382-Pelagomonas_calceolata.AAC.3
MVVWTGRVAFYRTCGREDKSRRHAGSGKRAAIGMRQVLMGTIDLATQGISWVRSVDRTAPAGAQLTEPARQDWLAISCNLSPKPQRLAQVTACRWVRQRGLLGAGFPVMRASKKVLSLFTKLMGLKL